jgi:Ca2+-binding EF-hand superfamily protein
VRATCSHPLTVCAAGELDFNQFTRLASAAFPKPEQQDGDLRKLMQMLDHDDNGKQTLACYLTIAGKVSEAELRQLLITVGEPLTHQEMDLLFEEVCVDDVHQLKR